MSMKGTPTDNVRLSFLVVTVCFALWGFANDITNPMVEAFQRIFRTSAAESTLVQVAFYGGYFAFALPAALIIRRYSYKSGILLGLAMFAVGALGFYPAALSGAFYPFLLAYFVLTCGLSMLETSANPYILTMGSKKDAAYRLNLAQAFNPIGSLLGMYVAMRFIQGELSPLTDGERSTLSQLQFETVKNQDLMTLAKPYLALGGFLILLFLVIKFLPLHSGEHKEDHFTFADLRASFGRILRTTGVRSGFVAQFFYVGAQIMCWTFIIHYGKEIFTTEGMSSKQAAQVSQEFNMAAMVIFCGMRFVCTYLMRFVSPVLLLAIASASALALCAVTVFVGGYPGLYALVAVSGCMSLMFPTIYSIALQRLDDEDTKLGGSTQIMAILGGSLLPLLQASVIDNADKWMWITPVSLSFLIPAFSFGVVLYFAVRQIVLRGNS